MSTDNTYDPLLHSLSAHIMHTMLSHSMIMSLETRV